MERGLPTADMGRTTMAKYMGVDLSYCNGGVDYKSLKKAKIDGDRKSVV